MVGAETFGGTLPRNWRAPYPGDRVDENDEERSPEYEEVFRHLTDSEPDDRNRNHRCRRQIAQELDDWIEQVVQ